MSLLVEVAEGVEVAAGPSALPSRFGDAATGSPQLVDVAEGIEVATGPSAFLADCQIAKNCP